ARARSDPGGNRRPRPAGPNRGTVAPAARRRHPRAPGRTRERGRAVRHDFTRGRGRWAACLTGAVLAGTGLCGCANFWDDVTSRDFKVSSLWTARPAPLLILRDSNDGDERARALRALREPKQHGGSAPGQDMGIQGVT